MIQRLRLWEQEGGPTLERSEIVAAPESSPEDLPAGLGVRAFTRPIDTAWRRTSYSALLRAASDVVGVASEPESPALDDEPVETLVAPHPGATGPGAGPGSDLPSPMADLPGGADLGSLVHGVLEEADPTAGDLEAELARHVADQLPWWPVEAPVADLAAALVPLHHTPLGPLLPELTLAQIGGRDRLRELDFEIPLAGGDRGPFPDLRLRELAGLLEHHLDVDDPVRPYADRLHEPGLGDQPLRGYLSGSIDVVLRAPGPRYLVVDYKTNWLGEGEHPLTAADYAPARLRGAMLHSDYPLQAMLYTVVLHRYLRWRQPGYDPAVHLGGVLYLYVRGMCGPQTPVVEGHPAGVFSWHPPPGLVTDLSDLLDGRRAR